MFFILIEWTVVQLTPQYNHMDEFNEDNDLYHTNPIHISVFKCGKNQPKPFLVTVTAPRDPVNGKYMYKNLFKTFSNDIFYRNTSAISKRNGRDH